MPRNQELNQQMRAESQAQIVAAARHLFATQGYYSCKVADVAREAGMSTGNVYWYYAGKEELLKTVLADGFATQEALLHDASTQPGMSLEKLDYLVEQYLALFREQSEFLTVLLSVLGQGGTPFLEKLGFDTRQIGLRYHQLLRSILTQGQAESELADLDPDMLAMLFFSLFNGLVLTYGEDWHVIPPEAIKAAVLRLVGARP